MDFSGLLNKLNSLGKPDDWVVDAVLALEAKSDLVKLAVVNATDKVAIKLVNKLLEEKEYLRSTRVQAQRAEAQKRTAGGSGGDSETGGAAAADTAHGSYERVMQAVYPSRVFNLSFQLFNGGHLALQLVFLATGAGISGTVRHISPLQSEFTLVVAEEQTMTAYLRSFQPRGVHVLRVREVPPDGPYVVVNACGSTDDQALLTLGWGGKLVSTFVSSEVQLSIEGADRGAKQEEGASQHSLSRSSSASVR